MFEAREACLSSAILTDARTIGSDEVVLSLNVDPVDPDVAAPWTRCVEREEELYLVNVGPARAGTRDKVVSVLADVDFESVPVTSVDSVDIWKAGAGKDCVRVAGYELDLRVEDSLVAFDIEDDPRRSDLSTKLREVESEVSS